jgi:Raf kinase inhibitor-like YbhB/YbcL family protein
MKRIIPFLLVCVVVVIILLLILIPSVSNPNTKQIRKNLIKLPPAEAGFVLISPEFANGGPIPAQYTCDGKNIPPPLAWGEPPAGTKSYVLLVEDPDAPGGPWMHYIVYNLPAQIRTIDFLTKADIKINGIPVLFGINSWGTQGYRGPCPPSGTHHYLFTLSAMDNMTGLGDKASINELASKMQGHILGYAELTGTYSK